MSARRGLLGWIEERSGAVSETRAFLGKPLPPNVGWLHTLGGLALVYLVLQTVTGILLAFYYNPSPEHAFASVQYVREELVLGALVHQLHHHGAGFVLATAALHLARSFFLAAYKKPREILWLSGVALFGLLFLFAFTGYLLPYHQNGYWATIVGLNIVADTPFVGDAARDVLTGGYEELGPIALSRFFLLHVCVLPLGVFALIGFHLKVLQRVGSAGPTDGAQAHGLNRPFFPGQAFRDVVAAALGTLLLLAVALSVGVEGHPPASADQGDFVPRPEWYFLPHFELLRVLPGPQQLATFWIPNLFFLALLLLPFLDRSPERRLARRKGFAAAGLTVIAGLLVLGAMGASHEPPATEEAVAETAGAPAGAGDPERGSALFFGEHECSTCHVVNGEGIEYGPDLSRVAAKVQDSFFEPFLRDPTAWYPITDMPAFDGSEQELADVLAYLRTLR